MANLTGKLDIPNILSNRHNSLKPSLKDIFLSPRNPTLPPKKKREMNTNLIKARRSSRTNRQLFKDITNNRPPTASKKNPPAINPKAPTPLTPTPHGIKASNIDLKASTPSHFHKTPEPFNREIQFGTTMDYRKFWDRKKKVDMLLKRSQSRRERKEKATKPKVESISKQSSHTTASSNADKAKENKQTLIKSPTDKPKKNTTLDFSRKRLPLPVPNKLRIEGLRFHDEQSPKTIKLNSSCQELKNSSINEYQMGSLIGQGAYAAVKSAHHRKTGLRVAIKVYEKFRLLDLQRKKSVNREIRILQKLNHPHIVKLFEIIDTSKQVRIVNIILDFPSYGIDKGTVSPFFLKD